MIFLSVELERFRSFQSRARWKIPSPGLYYLTGRNELNPELEANGVGKTSLLQAIFWVLFGKTTFNLKAGDVANWKTPRGCWGRLVVKTQHDRVVERQWGPNKLLLDGEEVDQATLERELGTSPYLFTYTVLFPQEGVTFLDLKPEPKMELLTEVLDLHLWDKASVEAVNETNALQTLLSQTEGRLAELDGALDTLDAEPILERAAAWDRQQKDSIRQLEAHIKGIKVPVVIGSRPDLRSLYREEAAARAELRTLTGRLNDLSALSGGVCPTCGGKLDRAHYRAEKDALTKKIEAAQANANDAGRRVKHGEDRDAQARRAEQAKGEVKNYEARIANLKAQQNPHDEQARGMVVQRALTRLRVAELRSALHRTTENRELAKFWIKGFKEVRLLVVNAVIAQLEAEVNQTIHELGLHGWQIRFDVERDTKSGGVQRGFTTMILSPDNKEFVPWDSWSGGEKQRLRMAGAFGFANLIHSVSGQGTNLEMWDEPSNWMSARGISQLLESLAQRSHRYNRCIVVADHRALGAGVFSGRITVVKNRNGSYIERGNNVLRIQQPS